MACIRALALAALVFLSSAYAAVPGPGTAVQAVPRLANLRIDIWPEFDRPAVLVIVKGELSPDTPLPAPVSLRIPATSGGPSAVAFANAPGSGLFNLQHEVTSAGNDLTVRFSAPQRFFHIEYYDALAIGSSERNYTFIWSGDLAVDRLAVSLQTPAGATDLSVLPDLGPGTAGADGLIYRNREFGAHEAGKQFVAAIRYAKADSRTSAQILGLGAPGAKPPETAGSAASSPAWGPVVSAAVGLSVGLGLPLLWWLWRRRKPASAAAPPAAGFCTKCGNALAAGDRFCSSCGKAVRKR